MTVIKDVPLFQFWIDLSSLWIFGLYFITSIVPLPSAHIILNNGITSNLLRKSTFLSFLRGFLKMHQNVLLACLFIHLHGWIDLFWILFYFYLFNFAFFLLILCIFFIMYLWGRRADWLVLKYIYHRLTPNLLRMLRSPECLWTSDPRASTFQVLSFQVGATHPVLLGIKPRTSCMFGKQLYQLRYTLAS